MQDSTYLRSSAFNFVINRKMDNIEYINCHPLVKRMKFYLHVKLVTSIDRAIYLDIKLMK